MAYSNCSILYYIIPIILGSSPLPAEVNNPEFVSLYRWSLLTMLKVHFHEYLLFYINITTAKKPMTSNIIFIK